MSDRSGPWFHTCTGVKFHPFDPRKEDVSFEDIAHALSHICRFGGHCCRFFSIAQHSIWLSNWVGNHGGDKALQLLALHASSWKAYLPEIARPIKSFLYFEAPDMLPDTFPAAARRIHNTICEAFGIPSLHSRQDLIEEGERLLLHSEAAGLMGSFVLNWEDRPPADQIIKLPEVLESQYMKGYFIRRHRELLVGFPPQPPIPVFQNP